MYHKALFSCTLWAHGCYAILEWCELPVSASMLGGCLVCDGVDESYTIVQWSAHVPGKQKVPGSKRGWKEYSCHGYFNKVMYGPLPSLSGECGGGLKTTQRRSRKH